MKQYVYDFYGENELEEVIDRFRQERREKAGLFITLYHESNDLEKVKESIQTLRKAFPQSAIAGMSASGGIKDGRMVLGKSVLAFLSFEDTARKYNSKFTGGETWIIRLVNPLYEGN